MSEWTNRGAKRAREARRDLGLDPHEPVADLVLTVEGAGAHVLVLDLPDDLAGAFLGRPGLPLLVICGTDFVGRQRFTLAHELGHFRIGHDPHVDRLADVRGQVRSQREVEANAFAAEFLIPRAGLLAWAEARSGPVTLEDVCVLACRYGVSAVAMRFQLATAGLLTDGGLARRLDEEIADGTHAELCFQLGLSGPDDTLARMELPRLPAVLRDSKLGDLLAGATDVAGFAERLGRTPAEAERMLANMGLDVLLPAAAEL